MFQFLFSRVSSFCRLQGGGAFFVGQKWGKNFSRGTFGAIFQDEQKRTKTATNG